MDYLLKRIDEAKELNNKLVLIVGQPGSGKSRLIHKYSEDSGIPILDVSKVFGHLNKDIDIMKTMKDFLKTYKQKVLLLDNKQVLYDQDSSIDLLEFLKEISKEITVVATWNGFIEDGQLTHLRKNAPNDLIYPINTQIFKYVTC